MPLMPLPDFLPVYLTAEIRAIEHAVASAANAPNLMQRAGLAAAELAREIIPGKGYSVLVLAGPGNNGGDAFLVARHLKQWWFDVSAVFAGDAAKLSADASGALAAWRDSGGETCSAIPPGKRWDLLVDGLFGIGLQREIAAPYLDLVRFANAQRAPVLAIDIPSGLASDTGRILGQAVCAAHTVTFIGLKPGLLTGDGPDCCGEIHLRNIGIEAAAIQPPNAWLTDHRILAGTLAPRPRNSHKGMFGDVGILGGADGMVGAALLAGRAALKIGAGRVFCGLLAADAPRVDFAQPELMLRAPNSLLEADKVSVLAVGPGLGTSANAAYVVRAALERDVSLVLDADALNLIAADSNLQEALVHRTAPSVITPHPAEAARLLATDTRTIQADRVTAAKALAERFNAAVVLKGAGSLCAFPNGTWYVNPTGNPGMASAGMGDVLSGLIAGLLAQGADPLRATVCGVYLHGAAADLCVSRGIGPAGITASDVTDAARDLMNGTLRRDTASAGAEIHGMLDVK